MANLEYSHYPNKHSITDLKTQLPSTTHKIDRNINRIQSYLSNNQNIYQHLHLCYSLSLLQTRIYNKQFWSFRNQIINKIVIWHRKIKLNKFILFDSIAIIDRYIYLTNQLPNQEQLILGAFLISKKKYSRPKKKLLSSWIKNVSSTVDPEQVLQMEMNIIIALQFNIQVPNSFELMQIIIMEMELQEQTFMLIRYFLELSFLLQYQHPKHEAVVALASTYLAVYFLEGTPWSYPSAQKFNISFEEIEKYCERIFQMVMRANKQLILETIYLKYAKKCYLEVSTIKFGIRDEENFNDTICQSNDTSKSEILETLNNSQQLK